MNSVVHWQTTAKLAAGLLLLVAAAQAAVVTRGPYLQQGATNSVVVRWRTDSAEASFVRVGASFGAWFATNGSALSVTEHIVAVSNLLPATKYFYQFGSGTNWFAATTNHFVITAPPIGTRGPTRIWALGDPGTQNSAQAASRDSYYAFNGARPTDVWLMLGDNAYDAGTDTQYQGAVFDFYPTMMRNTVMWLTIGNHDAGTAEAGPYLANFTLPENGEVGGVSSGTERYYSFDYANIHFVCLDSATSDRDSTAPMCTWLQNDLANTTQDWIIAFWHHPPYSKGSHDSDAESGLIEMRQNALPILESYGVDLVLNGHSHGYERSMLLDGHYGTSTTLNDAMKKDSGNGRETGDGAYQKPAGIVAHQGAVYTVAGSSGHATGGFYDHPAMKVSLDLVGSVVIDVLSNRLDLIFLTGPTNIADSFTIIKAAPPTNAPAAPTALNAVAVSASEIDLSWTDNANDEQGFYVERSTNGIDFAQVAVVGVNVTNRADTGLFPQRTYYYRVRAYNSAGVSPYSNIAQATTFAGPPPPDTNAPAPVTGLIVTSTGSNSITLQWTAPGDDGNSGTAASYDIRYRTNLITTSNWATATQTLGEPLPALAGTTQSFTITGLTAGRIYYFALRTSDEATNASPISNVATGTTLLPGGGGSSFAFIIASNSVWKFLDNGSNQSNAWQSLSYNDAAWASGLAALGYGGGEVTTVSYGPSSSAKYITTYFRKHFTMGDPSVFTSVKFVVQRDDGVVVYLNGAEVWRDNLPTNAINYLTVASTNVSGNDDSTFFSTPLVPASLLVSGDNVVAAEVHQRSASSGDMIFNLELRGYLAPPLARIVSMPGGSVVLRWATYPGKQYQVQFATNIPTTNWSPLGANVTATGFASSVTNAASNSQRFFRIVLVN